MVETGRAPVGNGWNLEGGDVIEVLTAVAEERDGQPTGYYSVTYLAGLDARTRPDLAPIRRWVAAAAQVHPAVRRLTSAADRREARTVSAEGQSVSYEPRRRARWFQRLVCPHCRPSTIGGLPIR